jgi:hypothetical protein
MSAITELAGSGGRAAARDAVAPGATERERFARALDESLPQLRPQPATQAEARSPSTPSARDVGHQGDGAPPAEVLTDGDGATDAASPAATGSSARGTAIARADEESTDSPVDGVDRTDDAIGAELPQGCAPVAGAAMPGPVDAPTAAGGAIADAAGPPDAVGGVNAAASPSNVELEMPVFEGPVEAAVRFSNPGAAGGVDAKTFADLVELARAAQRASDEIPATVDAATAAMGVARADARLSFEGGMPAAPSSTPADAVRLAQWLLQHNPLVATGTEAVRMSFPEGSGPIEQIVFSRDAGALSVLVSSSAGARDLVQRSLGDLERRLRERGLAVSGVRMAQSSGPGDSAPAHQGASGGVG